MYVYAGLLTNEFREAGGKKLSMHSSEFYHLFLTVAAIQDMKPLRRRNSKKVCFS